MSRNKKVFNSNKCETIQKVFLENQSSSLHLNIASEISQHLNSCQCSLSRNKPGVGRVGALRQAQGKLRDVSRPSGLCIWPRSLDFDTLHYSAQVATQSALAPAWSRLQCTGHGAKPLVLPQRMARIWRT